MFKNIFLKTVRDTRLSVIIWGGGLGLLMLADASSYNQRFSGANRPTALEDLQKISDSFGFLVGRAYDLGTFGGYLTTRVLGMLPAIISILAIIWATGLLRGEEEKGSLDLLLSTPHTRRVALFQKWAGMTASLAGLCLLSWSGLALGAVTGKLTLDYFAAAIAHLGIWLVTVFYGSLALALSQLASRWIATGWAGAILGATYMLNSLSSSLGGLEWLKYLSPFYYYNLSKPLAPSVGTDWISLAVLALLSLPLVFVAYYMYVHRDQGSNFTLISRTSQNLAIVPLEINQPGEAWLANSFAFGLGKALKAACIWGLSLGALVAVMTATLKNIGLGTYLSYENLLQQGLFGKITVFYAAFAITQVAMWAGEETEKRLEVVLSVPLTRWRLLIGRLAVAGLAAALVVGISWLAFWPSAVLSGLEVNGWNVAAAFLGLWVVCVVIEAVGFAIAAFVPNLAIGILAGLVALSFFFEILAEAFKLPVWLVNLSIFHQYGAPVVSGLNTGVIVALITVSLVLAIVATIGFERRDIAK